jgi:hypothetical protein
MIIFIKNNNPARRASDKWPSRHNRKENKQPGNKPERLNDKSKAKSKEATNYLVDVAKGVEHLPQEGATIYFTIETLALTSFLMTFIRLRKRQCWKPIIWR